MLEYDMCLKIEIKSRGRVGLNHLLLVLYFKSLPPHVFLKSPFIEKKKTLMYFIYTSFEGQINTTQ